MPALPQPPSPSTTPQRLAVLEQCSRLFAHEPLRPRLGEGRCARSPARPTVPPPPAARSPATFGQSPRRAVRRAITGAAVLFAWNVLHGAPATPRQRQHYTWRRCLLGVWDGAGPAFREITSRRGQRRLPHYDDIRPRPRRLFLEHVGVPRRPPSTSSRSSTRPTAPEFFARDPDPGPLPPRHRRPRRHLARRPRRRPRRLRRRASRPPRRAPRPHHRRDRHRQGPRRRGHPAGIPLRPLRPGDPPLRPRLRRRLPRPEPLRGSPPTSSPPPSSATRRAPSPAPAPTPPASSPWPARTAALFLDEIDELPESVQVRLLRPLQNRACVPLGERKSRKIEGASSSLSPTRT